VIVTDAGTILPVIRRHELLSTNKNAAAGVGCAAFGARFASSHKFSFIPIVFVRSLLYNNVE